VASDHLEVVSDNVMGRGNHHGHYASPGYIPSPTHAQDYQPVPNTTQC